METDAEPLSNSASSDAGRESTTAASAERDANSASTDAEDSYLTSVEDDHYDFAIFHSDAETDLATTVKYNIIRNVQLENGTPMRVEILESLLDYGTQEVNALDSLIDRTTILLFFRTKEFFSNELKSFAASAALENRIRNPRSDRKWTFVPLDLGSQCIIEGKPTIDSLIGVTLGANGELPPKAAKNLLRLYKRKLKLRPVPIYPQPSPTFDVQEQIEAVPNHQLRGMLPSLDYSNDSSSATSQTSQNSFINPQYVSLPPYSGNSQDPSVALFRQRCSFQEPDSTHKVLNNFQGNQSSGPDSSMVADISGALATLMPLISQTNPSPTTGSNPIRDLIISLLANTAPGNRNSAGGFDLNAVNAALASVAMSRSSDCGVNTVTQLTAQTTSSSATAHSIHSCDESRDSGQGVMLSPSALSLPQSVVADAALLPQLARQELRQQNINEFHPPEYWYEKGARPKTSNPPVVSSSQMTSLKTDTRLLPDPQQASTTSVSGSAREDTSVDPDLNKATEMLTMTSLGDSDNEVADNHLQQTSLMTDGSPQPSADRQNWPDFTNEETAYPREISVLGVCAREFQASEARETPSKPHIIEGQELTREVFARSGTPSAPQCPPHSPPPTSSQESEAAPRLPLSTPTSTSSSSLSLPLQPPSCYSPPAPGPTQAQGISAFAGGEEERLGGLQQQEQQQQQQQQQQGDQRQQEAMADLPEHVARLYVRSRSLGSDSGLGTAPRE